MKLLPPLLAALALSACTLRPICPASNSWVSPATLNPVPDPVAQAATHRIVLLGEQHDRMQDHHFELDTIERIAATQPVALGFEMLPRSDQPVLDAWVAGKLTEAEFLKQSKWDEVWGFDPNFYWPIFRFARDHHIPMVALNVSDRTVHLVAKQGFANVPANEREGLTTPAPATPAYRKLLADVMSGHDGPKMSPETLNHFIDAQLTWDRAMAEAIAHQLTRDPTRTVVAIMGAGHLEDRNGVPHQLASLGYPDALVLIPAHQICEPPGAGYADAVYVE